MTIYRLAAFGGEAPSVSDRALGSDFARVNENLFLPSGEFWPMAADRRHSACVSGARTLHRMARNANGEVVKDPAAPIRSLYRRAFIREGPDQRRGHGANLLHHRRRQRSPARGGRPRE